MGIKKFDLLVGIYIFCICVSELMGAKTFPIATIGSFTLSASVAIFVFPLLFTVNDIIIEVFGKPRAQSVVKTGIVIIALILLASLTFTALPPTTRFAVNEEAYDTIFGLSARIAAASLTAFIISAFLDIQIFARIRAKMGKQALWFRNNVSNISAQFVDTTLFITLAFYSFSKPFDDNFFFLLGLIIPYWLLKSLMSIVETPLVYAGVKWLKTEK
jgi:uncharacterized integral membrane protein (TIGR00697 family)